MPFTGIYVSSLLEFQYKCGAGCSATSKAEAYANSFIQQAESIINVMTRKVHAVDTTAFTALPSTTKYLLTDAASNLAAIYAIQFDMKASFTSRIEAEDMVNILRDGFLRDISILRDKKMQNFLATGTEN